MESGPDANRYAPPGSAPQEPFEPGPRPSPRIAAALSLLAPGAGQYYARDAQRALIVILAHGLAIAGAFLLALVLPLAVWLTVPFRLLVAADAFRSARRATRPRASLVAVALLTFACLLAAGLLAQVGKSSVVDAYRVTSGSMTPVLLPGDYVAADKLAYLLGDPERGTSRSSAIPTIASSCTCSA